VRIWIGANANSRSIALRMAIVDDACAKKTVAEFTDE
jgi:hypothetical protein